MRKLLLIPIIFSLFVSCQRSEVKETLQQKDIKTQKDYAMLVVESESCIYCKQLEKDLRENQQLKEKIHSLDFFRLNYESNAKVSYRLLGQEGITTENNLARTLGVNSFPHIFFYTKDGDIVLSLPGYVPPKTLSCIIDYVSNKEYERRKLQDYLRDREC